MSNVGMAYFENNPTTVAYYLKMFLLYYLVPTKYK